MIRTMSESQAARIISKFGNAARLAKAMDTYKSVVHGWKVRGYIPAARQAEVLEAARKAGIDLTPDDFFESQKTK